MAKNPFALSPERQAERDRSDKMWSSAAKTLKRAKRSGIISSAGDLLKKNDRELDKRHKSLGTSAGDKWLKGKMSDFAQAEARKSVFQSPEEAAKARTTRRAQNNASSRALQEARKSGTTGDVSGDTIKKGADARLAKAKELKTQRAADRTDRAAIKEKLGYNKPVDPVVARMKSLGAEFSKNQAEIDTKNKASLDAQIKGKAARVNAERAVKGDKREYAESYGAKYNPNTGSYDYPKPEAKQAFDKGQKDLKAERSTQIDKDIKANQERTAKLTKLGGGDYEKGLKMSKGGEPAIPGETSDERNIARERSGGGGGGKGKGRGNWGHKGRPGVRGGSA